VTEVNELKEEILDVRRVVAEQSRMLVALESGQHDIDLLVFGSGQEG